MLTATMIVTLGLGACGSGGDGRDEPSGNAGTGRFDPPPIQTNAPEAVRNACKVSSPTIDRIKKDGVLFWAIGPTPPFGIKLDDGKWTGVEAQNAAELATVLGVDFDIGEYQYDVLPQALVTGQADIVGAQLFVTDERKRVIDFSIPYDQAGQAFYVLEHSRYETIGDLNKPGVRFVYGSGAAQRVLARKYIPKAKIAETPLHGQIILHDFLAAHRADATMADAVSMQRIIEKYDDPPVAAIGLNGRITGKRASYGEMIDPFDVAFGLPKGDNGWRGCVNAWVQDLLDSGRMGRRLDYWLAQPVA